MPDMAGLRQRIATRIRAGVQHPLFAALSGVFGFLLSYSFLFYIIGAYASSCGHRREDAYLSALILGGGTVCLSILLLHLARQHARILRWFVLPHIATLAFSISMLPGYLLRVSFLGEHLCAQGRAGLGRTWPEALAWHRYYGVIMVVYILVFAAYMIWYWQLPRPENNKPQGPAAAEVVPATQWKFLLASWAGFFIVCIAGSAIAELWFNGNFKNFLVGAFVAPGGPVSWFVFQDDLVLAVKVSALSIPLLFLMVLHPYLGRTTGRWASFTGVFLWFLAGAMALRYTPL